MSRREGVYNRTGEPSVIFAEKEELHSERETAKGCCERYEANDDVVGRWLAAAVKSQQNSNYIFILYRRGELCSPVFYLL